MGKESACQCRRHWFDPWVMKIPWKRKWQPTPVFLPGKSYGQKSLVGYSPWGWKIVGQDLVAKLCPTLLQPRELQPTRLLCQWDFPGKNTGVGCHFLFQEIFLAQGLNPGLPHCRQTLYCLSHQGSPRKQGRVLIKEVKNILEKSFGYRVKNSQVIVNKENVYLKRRFRCIWMRRKSLDLFRRPKGSMTSHSQKEVEFSYSDNPFIGQWASVGGLSRGWTLWS